MRKHNKTLKKTYYRQQKGKGIGGLIGSIASEAMGSAMGGVAPSAAAGGGIPVSAAQSSTKDIMYASEIAGKELIQKICQSLNPPNSNVFLNVATNSIKTYLEGEDAKKMINEELKTFIANIFNGILNQNKYSEMLFLQTLLVNKDFIQNNVLLPAITKQIPANKTITLDEIPEIIDAIQSSISGISA